MPRPFARPGFGEVSLVVVLAAVVLGGGGWFVWDGLQNERDLERRWALPGEAKALAEEELDLAPPTVTALAEAELKAAAANYEAALAACPDAAEAARRRFEAESAAATAKAERRVKEWEARAAARRRELRQQALALVTEWDELFARHPEWPPHRLTPGE